MDEQVGACKQELTSSKDEGAQPQQCDPESQEQMAQPVLPPNRAAAKAKSKAGPKAQAKRARKDNTT